MLVSIMFQDSFIEDTETYMGHSMDFVCERSAFQWASVGDERPKKRTKQRRYEGYIPIGGVYKPLCPL